VSPKLEEQIAGLQQMKIKPLKERYRELFGEDSHSSNHTYLVRRIAWRLQAIAIGDLSEHARARAAELACDADLRLQPTSSVCRQIERIRANEQQTTSSCDPRIPPVGQTVTRAYRGRTVAVKIRADGFEWNGRVYGSLSAVAWHATGTRWNGYAFFGLTRQVQQVNHA
jgi:hypothetical protein